MEFTGASENVLSDKIDPQPEKYVLYNLAFNFLHEDLTHGESCDPEMKIKRAERCPPEF